MSEISSTVFEDLICIYKQVEENHFITYDSSAVITQSLEIGFKKTILSNELNILLLSVNTLHLMLIKLDRRMKDEFLYREILNEDTTTKLINIMITHPNKHVMYSIKQLLIDILFQFSSEKSKYLKDFIFKQLKEHIFCVKANYSLLEIVRDICSYKSNISLNFKCQDYEISDGRINEIQQDIFYKLLEIWSDLVTCLINKNDEEEIQDIILDIWHFILTMAIKIHPVNKEFLTLKQRHDLLEFSYNCSTSICFKFINVINQIFSECLKISNFPLEIIHFCNEIISEVINNWLFKIKFELNWNFSGTKSKEIGNIEDQNIGIIYICNVVLKAINIVIISNEKFYTEEILGAHDMLDRWLSFHKKGRSKYPNQIWLIEVFFDQDDQLLEMMICYLNLYNYLKSAENITINEDCSQTINPHIMFLEFLNKLNYDYSPLLDFLTSNETCILLYMVKYLKLIRSEWNNFLKGHEIMNHLAKNICDQCDPNVIDKPSVKGTAFSTTKKCNDISETTSSQTENNIFNLQKSFEVLRKLTKKIQKLTDKNLYPYNAQPLLYHLNSCLKQYDDYRE
ncbi:protein Lines homolog 1 [Centruroides vittatus]|uniref:protein Lines homolog 1 n=1 Tax=Centruroides vittatus TaxID=120091 RepID=UPI00350E9401